jgi:hypothetical protein
LATFLHLPLRAKRKDALYKTTVNREAEKLGMVPFSTPLPAGVVVAISYFSFSFSFFFYVQAALQGGDGV